MFAAPRGYLTASPQYQRSPVAFNALLFLTLGVMKASAQQSARAVMAACLIFAQSRYCKRLMPPRRCLRRVAAMRDAPRGHYVAVLSRGSRARTSERLKRQRTDGSGVCRSSPGPREILAQRRQRARPRTSPAPRNTRRKRGRAERDGSAQAAYAYATDA